jgi:hypothetical protein
MAKKTKQINIRIDDDTDQILPQIREAISQSLGIDVTYSDVFRLAIAELRKKYLAEEPVKSKKK